MSLATGGVGDVIIYVAYRDAASRSPSASGFRLVWGFHGNTEISDLYTSPPPTRPSSYRLNESNMFLAV